jgi:hypothetical protein
VRKDGMPRTARATIAPAPSMPPRIDARQILVKRVFRRSRRL